MVRDLLPLPLGCSVSWPPPPRRQRGCSRCRGAHGSYTAYDARAGG
jgi:hypothetical protein